jgi:hypothetical protein
MPDGPYMTSRLAAWRARTDWPLIVIAIGSLPLLLLELERSELPSSDRALIDIVNVVVLAAFAIDYRVELTVTQPCHRQRSTATRVKATRPTGCHPTRDTCAGARSIGWPARCDGRCRWTGPSTVGSATCWRIAALAS